jgi:hypothetical protein
MATSKPVLSGPEIAQRVQAAVQADNEESDTGGLPSRRPLAELYLQGHLSRMIAGHAQAILYVLLRVSTACISLMRL